MLCQNEWVDRYRLHRTQSEELTIQKWEIDNFKIKVDTFIIHLVETLSLVIDKCDSKNVASVLEVLALLSWSSEVYIWHTIVSKLTLLIF